MCARFTLKTPAERIASLFQLQEVPVLPPRYNIAPTQEVTAIRQESERGPRELVRLRWGLVPAWARSQGDIPLLVNARAETAATKPAFRAALRRRRCLIPADGLYEWQRQGRKPQPFHIGKRNGEPFALAGLWEQWQGPGGAGIASCVLLTTEANALLREIHDRMPVILSPGDYDRWLDPSIQDVGQIESLLRPPPAEGLMAYPVSPYVNNSRNDDLRCLLPLE